MLIGIKIERAAIKIDVKPAAAEPKAMIKVGAQHANPVNKLGKELNKLFLASILQILGKFKLNTETEKLIAIKADRITFKIMLGMERKITKFPMYNAATDSQMNATLLLNTFCCHSSSIIKPYFCISEYIIFPMVNI